MSLNPFRSRTFFANSSRDKARSPRLRAERRAAPRSNRSRVMLSAENLEGRAMLAGVDVVNTSYPNGTYGVGAQIPINLEFDAAVRVTGQPLLFMNSGNGPSGTTLSGFARYAGTSANNTVVTFMYTVGVGENSFDLDVFSAAGAIVNGSITNFGDGLPATLTLPTRPTSTNAMSFLKDIVIDTTAPVTPIIDPLRINPTIDLSDPPYFLAHPDYYTLSGSAGGTALQPGEQLRVSANGATWIVPVQPDGSWSVDMRHQLPISGQLNPWSLVDEAEYNVIATITDTAGNSASDLTIGEITIDMDEPSIVGINPTVAPGSYSVGDMITFDVIFDEDVEVGGSGLPFIRLNNGGIAVYQGTTGALMHFAYIVQATDSDIASLGLGSPAQITLNGGRVQDLAGNQPDTLNGTRDAVLFPAGLVIAGLIEVDVSAPTVASVTGLSPNGWYGPGQTIVIAIEFSEPVLVTGAPELSLNASGTAKATYLAPANPTVLTTVLRFAYTVTQGDSTTGFALDDVLKCVSPASLSFSGGVGSIVDRAGNDAVRTLPGVAINGTGPAPAGYYITSAPVVTAVTSPNLNGTYTAGDVIEIVVQFDRPIDVTQLPTLSTPVLPSLRLNALPTAAVATYTASSQVDRLSGRFILYYTVAAGDSTPTGVDLDYLTANSLQSGGFAITHNDARHVNAILALPVPGTSSIGSLDYNKNIRIELDTLAPLPPVLTLVDGTGSLGADNVTNNTTVRCTGLEPLSTWQYSINGGPYSAVIRTAASTTFTLPEGSYAPGTVKVRQIDASGNVGPDGVNAVLWVVDLTSPGIVTPSPIVDTGASSADGITSNGTVNVTGIEAGAVLQYSVTGDVNLNYIAATGGSFTLPAGNYAAGTIWVRQVDLAGNIGPSRAVNPVAAIVVDASAAALGVSLQQDTGSSATDRVTSNPALAFTGVETGAVVEYSTDNVTFAPSVTPVEGVNTVYVRQTDRAGNVSTATPFTFTLDRTSPLAVGVALMIDTGASAADLVTSNSALLLTGVEAGATVEYSVNNGAWSTAYAPTTGLVNVRVRQTDLAGNISAPTSFTFTYIVIPPATPSVRLTNDTGVSAVDLITTDPSLTVTGLVPGATVEYAVNGGGYSTIYTPIPGVNVVLVRQIDPAGNASAATAITFMWDTVAPVPLTLMLQSDTGSSNSDRITSNSAVVLGNRESGATVQYSADGITYSTAVPSPLADGSNTIYVRQVDLAGNISAVTALTYTLDRVAPVAPDVSLLLDTGVSTTDKITRDGTLVVNHVELPGVTIYYYNAESGLWLPSPFTPAQGQNTVLVRVTDVAGNNSPATTFVFEFDTLSPAAPLVTLLNDTGISNTDKITSVGTLLVTGIVNGATVSYSSSGVAPWSATAPVAVEGTNTVYVRQTDRAGNDSASSVITFTLAADPPPPVVFGLQDDTGISAVDLVTRNGTVIVSGVSPGNSVEYKVTGGVWTTTLTLVAGTNTGLVRQKNAAGVAGPSTAYSFVFDTTLPTTPTVGLFNDTGSRSTDRVTSDSQLLVTGVESGAQVSYSIDGGNSWNAVPATGTNSVLLPYVANQGMNGLLVRQTDVAGNSSPAVPFTFTYDTVAPGPLSVGLLRDTGWSAIDRVTNDPSLAILTPMTSGAVVEYLPAGAADWSPVFQPADGVNSVYVRRLDAAGNPSTAILFSFTYDVSVPYVTNVTSPNIDGTYGPGTVITIYVQLSEAVTVTAGTSAQLALNTGRAATLVTPASLATTVLSFNYTVQAGDVSPDLEYTSISALSQLSGAMRDVGGNQVDTLLPEPLPFGVLGGSLGWNKNLQVVNYLSVAFGVGSPLVGSAPQIRTAVTSIPILFSQPMTSFSLANVQLLMNNRVVSLRGARLIGAGTTWTLLLPALATNVRGTYRLQITGATAGVLGMAPGGAATYWRRV